MKIPLKIGDTTVTYECFTNVESQDRVVCIDERTYRLHALGDDEFYMMLRVGGHQRTLRGPLPELLRAIAQIHLTYRQYDTRVRRAKEDAQRTRDHALNAAAESLK